MFRNPNDMSEVQDKSYVYVKLAELTTWPQEHSGINQKFISFLPDFGAAALHPEVSTVKSISIMTCHFQRCVSTILLTAKMERFEHQIYPL